MSQPKLSISTGEALADEIRAAAAADGETVSAWMVDAAQAKLRNRALRQAVDESFAESGVSPEEAFAAYELARQQSILVGAPTQ